MNYHIQANNQIDEEIIDNVFSKVFRNQYNEEGFAIISFDEELDSKLLRKHMVDLKIGLSRKCFEKYKEEIDYYWLGRFSQQNTTKFHRDNAPNDSYLMLGYEPTKIESKLYFADYHKLITELKIPVDKYYELHNPIFNDGETLLKPYIKKVENFNNRTYKIVLMNNSDLNCSKTFGVLHKAEIVKQDLSQSRVINSMMLYLKPSKQENNKTKISEKEFLETDEISK